MTQPPTHLADELLPVRSHHHPEGHLIMDPDRLRTIAERVNGSDLELLGGEGGSTIARLFHAAASEDFLDFGDSREVRRAVHRLAELIDPDASTTTRERTDP